jgi:hypothetical protein
MTADSARVSRGVLPVLVVAALLLCLRAAVLGGGGAAAPEPLLLTGVRILDVRAGRYVATAGVLVDGGRVKEVFGQPPATLPPNARRIDLPGTTLVPGLGDMFASASPSVAADADFYYSMALAHGVTAYRVVGARLPWAAGQRERSLSGAIAAPRLWLAGPWVGQLPAAGLSTRQVADAAAAARVVKEQATLGADWIAMSGSTGIDVCRAIVRSARAAKMRVSGEAGAVSGADLIRAGIDAIDRIGAFAKTRAVYERPLQPLPDYPRDDADLATDYLWARMPAGDGRSVASLQARRRVFVIPLLASFNGTLAADAVKQDPGVALLPARWRDALEARAHPASWPGAATARRAAAARAASVKDLAAAGVRMVTGVDVASGGYTVPGAGVHRELAMLVAAGLSPADAIRAATINCAELLGAGDSLGQIAPGFRADLVAVEGDPLQQVEDLLRIKLIVRGGEVFERGSLLAQAKRAARN